jgi:hypothetical protein
MNILYYNNKYYDIILFFCGIHSETDGAVCVL